MSNKYLIKYPKDIAAVVKQSKAGTQTLSVTAELVEPIFNKTNNKGEPAGDSPLKFYNETFSRFPFTIIANKKYATANIPVKEIPNIIKRSNKVYDIDIERSLTPVSTPTNSNAGSQGSVQNSPAFTVQITSGIFKGKTPAQVLLENPNNLDKLGNQFNWLKSNLGKNPQYEEGNKKQMFAIKEAKELFVAGKLIQQEVNIQPAQSNFQSFVIYDSGVRPKYRNKREDGMSFIYSVKISWILGNKYPVNIEISNFYAPVVERENGLLNVQVASKDPKSEVKNTIKLSTSDWENILYMMQANMRTFENEISAKMRKIANDAHFQDAQSSKVQNIPQSNQPTKTQNAQQNNQTVNTPVRTA